MNHPRYPEIRLRLDSQNPLAWVSAVRQAMRRSGVSREEIQRFSSDALGAAGDATRARQVCSAWARIEVD